MAGALPGVGAILGLPFRSNLHDLGRHQTLRMREDVAFETVSSCPRNGQLHPPFQPRAERHATDGKAAVESIRLPDCLKLGKPDAGS